MSNCYRQGDVFLEEVTLESIPKKGRTIVPKDGDRTILAYGEVTGHAHAVPGVYNAELIELEDGSRFLISDGGITLVHEEHGAIELPAKAYKVTIQQEYQEDGSFQAVMD